MLTLVVGGRWSAADASLAGPRSRTGGGGRPCPPFDPRFPNASFEVPTEPVLWTLGVVFFLVASCSVTSLFEGTPERLTTELLELGYPLYVAVSFRWVADPPPYLDPGPGTKSLAEKREGH